MLPNQPFPGDMIIPGYTILEDVYRGRRRVLLRAHRERDGARVLLRTFVDAFPSAQDVAALRREAELLGMLARSGLGTSPTVVSLSDRPALVLDDPGGVTLKELIAGRGLEAGAFLRLAVGLAELAAALHGHGTVHLALTPSAFLVDPAGVRSPTLIACHLATRVGAGIEAPAGDDLDDGLAYVSPEQTGRTSRSVDVRSDLYTLGVTFYEMLTGRVPFEAGDSLEMVHSHLARRPPSPRTLVPDLPQPLGAMVLRLLAKSPDQRYPSAAALRADLADCLAEWERTGTLETVRAGEAGPRDRLEIPGRLYGRDEEVARLRAALDRASAGAVELVMVSGYAGIGKTALIRELADPATRPDGYLASGKFDQIVRVPYGAFIQAFRSLLQQLLGEDEARLTEWRTRLADSLGAGAAVLAEVVPEIEVLLGPQPTPPQLGPSEARNRFRLAVQHFVRTLSWVRHPLVLFLDDLQWADSATLDLLEPLLTGADVGHLLVVGAYRDNEVDAAHPLTRTLADLETAGIRLRRIQLGPLTLGDLGHLLTDTLEDASAAQLPLARLLLEKTGGNPFFVVQFLYALHRSGLVTFDYERRAWSFDLDTIARAGMTDNVIELMAAKIQRLSPKARNALTLGACIGNRFDLPTLAIVSRQSAEDAAADLAEAVAEGLLLPLAGPDAAPAYEFLHDRVQQGAYTVIPDDRKHLVHLAVGRLLREQWLPSAGEERLFDVVHHLNLGRRIIEEPAERLALAGLDLQAARRAKASTAYQAARGYLQAARDLLPPDAWSTEYDLALAIHLEAAECEYVTGDDDEAGRLVDVLLAQARTRLDRARVHRLRIVRYESLTRYADALAVGREALALFDLSFPDDPDAKADAVETAIEAIQRALGGRSIASLLDLPTLADPEIKALMTLLAALHTPCYLAGDKALTLLNTATMVRLSLLHGNTEESALAYVLYAMYLGPIRGDYSTAYDYGQLALHLHDRLPDPGLHARVLMNFSWAVSIWRRPFAESFTYTREAVRLANETGQFPDAGYALFNECYLGLLSGAELETVAPACDANVLYLRRVKMEGFVDGPAVIRQWALALQGRTRHPTSLDAGDFDEAAFLRVHRGESLFEMFYHAAKLALLCTFGEYEDAVALAEVAEGPIRQYTGTIWDALRVFHHALALCARYDAWTGADRDRVDATLDAAVERLARWAGHAPDNFAAHHLIVTAELARVRGRPAEAIEHYEAALAAARHQVCPRERALASELFGRFWLARGQPRIAAAYLGEARAAYLEWGAAAKAAALDAAYRDLLGQAGPLRERQPPGGGGLRAGPGQRDEGRAGHRRRDRARGPAADAAPARAGERGRRAGRPAARARRRGVGPCVRHRGVDRRDAVGRRSASPTFPGCRSGVVNYARRSGNASSWRTRRPTRATPAIPTSRRNAPARSLCAPVLNQGRLVGTLYAENNLTPGTFTPERLEVTRILASHAAIAITNAELFAEVAQLRDRLQAENVYLREEVKEHHGLRGDRRRERGAAARARGRSSRWRPPTRRCSSPARPAPARS